LHQNWLLDWERVTYFNTITHPLTKFAHPYPVFTHLGKMTYWRSFFAKKNFFIKISIYTICLFQWIKLYSYYLCLLFYINSIFSWY